MGQPTNDPHSMDELSARFDANQRVEGMGFDTRMVVPCPFCGAADFMVWNVADYGGMVQTMQTPTCCADCGRSGRLVITMTGDTTYSTLIQTDGPDVPDWFVPKPTRE